MSNCTINGTVQTAGGVAVPGAIVRVNVIPPLVVGDAGISQTAVETATAGDGSWSLSVIRAVPAHITIPQMKLAADFVVPSAASATFGSLTLYATGTLVPATIYGDIASAISAMLGASTLYTDLVAGYVTLQASYSALAGAIAGLMSGVIAMNPSTMTADLTIPAGYNAYSAGPLTIGEGINVTVTDGGNWSVL